MSMPPVPVQEGNKKRLYRSHRDRMIGGVAGGLANYFAVDPVVMRVGMVALLIFTAVIPAVIFYVVCIFLIPAEPWS